MGACAPHGVGEGGKRAPGGHHVVHDRHVGGAAAHGRKGAPHVAAAAASAEFGLRPGVAHPAAQHGRQRDPQARRDGPGQLQCLIEAAAALTRRVQRHGKEQLRLRTEALGEPIRHQLAQQARMGQATVELELAQQVADRRLVGECRDGLVEGRRSPLTAATQRPWRRGSKRQGACAARARVAVPREVPEAAGADLALTHAGTPAEGASRRQQPPVHRLHPLVNPG